VLILAALAAACSGERAPTAPTVNPIQPSQPATRTLSGTIVATQTAAPVRSVTAAPFGVSTNDAGRLPRLAQARAPRITIEASGYVARSTSL